MITVPFCMIHEQIAIDSLSSALKMLSSVAEEVQDLMCKSTISLDH